jgi:hypothetical protein
MTKANPHPPITVMPHDDCIIGTKLAAQITDLSEWSLGQAIRAGRGPRTVRLCGRKIGIKVADLKAWIASKETSQAA